MLLPSFPWKSRSPRGLFRPHATAFFIRTVIVHTILFLERWRVVSEIIIYWIPLDRCDKISKEKWCSYRNRTYRRFINVKYLMFILPYASSSNHNKRSLTNGSRIVLSPLALSFDFYMTLLGMKSMKNGFFSAKLTYVFDLHHIMENSLSLHDIYMSTIYDRIL